MFPHVHFAKRGEMPKVMIYDKYGKKIVTIYYEEYKEGKELAGLAIFDEVFIFPQSTFNKILTIFHEFLHWLNYKLIIDSERIDKLIDKMPF